MAAAILTWALALGLLLYSGQTRAADCKADLLRLGHAEAVAIQAWQAARSPARPDGSTWAQPMTQAAADYLRIEKACTGK